MTILIVEDDTAQAHYAEALLTRMGVQCRVATTLQDAVAKLGSRHISGVLCDLVLDTGSGLEVAKICNETRTPIVFVTATCDEHNVGKMYEYGFVIEKPVRISALARAVEYFKYANKAIAFPPQADCETLRDYFEWHVQNGRSKYRCEMREHYPALPPHGDTHDDDEKIVFIRGVH